MIGTAVGVFSFVFWFGLLGCLWLWLGFGVAVSAFSFFFLAISEKGILAQQKHL